MGAWLEVLLRLLHYAVLLGLFGWLVFPMVGLRGLDRVIDVDRSPAVLMAAIVAPLLSAALMLTSIAAMMGLPVGGLDWPTIEAMLIGTDMGWAFLIRTALLLAALLALMLRQRFASALLYAAALMTLGWNGHAAATEGGLGLAHRLNNGVHLIAAGMWLGAIAWFWALTTRAQHDANTDFASALLRTMHRFAPIGAALVAFIVLTGIVNAQLIFGLGNIGDVPATGYGMLLITKLALVLAMLGFGARNALGGRRYANTAKGEPIDAVTTVTALRRSLAGEMAFGVGVVALVALLGMLSPIMM